MTLSGKTNLAKRLASEYKRQGVPVVVLDPLNDPEWACDFLTRDADQFMNVARGSRQCALFIDETGDALGKFDTSRDWLATRARHYGHKSHFITQRPAQMSRTVWTQCTELFLFNISEYDAKLLANEFNQPDLKRADSLGPYECFHARKMKGCKHFRPPEFVPEEPEDGSDDTDSGDGADSGRLDTDAEQCYQGDAHARIGPTEGEA